MLQTKTFLSILGVVVLVFSLNTLQAATQLRINAAGDLEILDSKGLLVKSLSNGSISQSVKSDNQAFKVSYGKDLKGRFTTIVYPDPEKPQTISLNVFKQDVIISSDAVLTVVAEKDLNTARLQSGVLGKISVAGTDLGAGNSVNIQNGAVVANTPPAPQPASKITPTQTQTAQTQKSNPAAVTIAEAPQQAPATAEDAGDYAPENYDGAHTRKIEGDVMIAPKGQTVVDAIKNSPTTPRLDLNQPITPGSTIQTGPDGKAYIAPFPGAILMLEPNTTVEFEELEWKKSNGKVERKMTAFVKQGSVISAIKGIKPEDLDYKVKTPHGVAAARGTVYITRNNGSSTTVVVSQGRVQVVTAKGTFTIGVDAGNKVTFTAGDANSPTYSTANIDDIRQAERLLAAVQEFIGLDTWRSGTGNGDDRRRAASPALDALIGAFQSTFEPDLTPAPMTPTTSPQPQP